MGKKVNYFYYSSNAHLVTNDNGGYFLYLIGAYPFYRRKTPLYLKIGHTNNLKNRFDALDCASPVKLKLLDTIQNNNKKNICLLERKFKKAFTGFRSKREWFYFDELLINYFKELKNGKR